MASAQDLPGRVSTGTTTSSPASAPTTTTPPGALSADAYTIVPERTPARSFLVAMILVLLVGSTLAMVAFIWYRWMGVREPTTAVIVEGDATLDGTEVIVRGPDRTVTAKLTGANGYVAPVLLEPGIYLVVAQRDGQVLIRKQVEVKRFLGVRFQLAEYVKQAIAEGSLQPLAPRTAPKPDSTAEPGYKSTGTGNP